MSRFRPLLIVVLLVAAAVIAWRFLASRPRAPYLSGYIVGDNLDLGASVSGTVASIAVADGQRVSAGQALFRIAPATLEAQGEQAAANIRATQTQISTAQANLRQAQASVAASEATAERARRDLARLESVKRDDPAAVANKDIDQARASYREAQANVIAAQKAADARSAEIGQARAQTEQAIGGRRSVDIQVAQLSPVAPAAGLVQRVYFQPGEWVVANQPVVSLIPDAKVKVRFFVPEPNVSLYRPGKTVHFSCDGCAPGLSGRIGYVSADPEFTPPIIFSRENRDRLVFMVEAYPSNPTKLNPGQPVEVQPLP
jgi:HlyD family secretion protein